MCGPGEAWAGVAELADAQDLGFQGRPFTAVPHHRAAKGNAPHKPRVHKLLRRRWPRTIRARPRSRQHQFAKPTDTKTDTALQRKVGAFDHAAASSRGGAAEGHVQERVPKSIIPVHAS